MCATKVNERSVDAEYFKGDRVMVEKVHSRQSQSPRAFGRLSLFFRPSPLSPTVLSGSPFGSGRQNQAAVPMAHIRSPFSLCASRQPSLGVLSPPTDARRTLSGFAAHDRIRLGPSAINLYCSSAHLLGILPSP
jgi:hypothetical protein